MVVRGRAEYLPRAIEGLRGQTLRGFELIIVDDGADDTTWDYLAQLSLPRLRVHRNLASRGWPAALNQALTMAQGRYVAFHDAEGFSLPERLGRQAAYLNTHSRVALVGGQVEWVDLHGQVVRRVEYPPRHADLVAHLRQGFGIELGIVMLRRSILDKVGFFREPFMLGYDDDLFLRVAGQRNLAALPELLYRRQFDPSSEQVARLGEWEAYSALARQLDAERASLGRERADYAALASAIAERYQQKHPLARQAEQAVNYVRWAERLLSWGVPSGRYAWPMWQCALAAWPFSPTVWKFAARHMFDRNARQST
jgi:glycosyltransferase involved in cell wall biosynthesis